MKKKIRFFVLLTVCAAIIICFVGASGAQVGLGANGKGSVTVKYEKQALGTESESTEAFTAYVKMMIASVNTASGESNMAVLNSIRENEENYEVKISFRRIDGIKGLGDFVWSDFSAAVARESETQTLINRFAQGNYRMSLGRNYNGMVGLVSLERDASDVKLTPTAADGERLTADEFYEVGDVAKNSRFAAFRILDVGAISELKIETAGKITYVSSNCTVEGGGTLTVKPMAVTADIQKFIQTTDEQGNPVYNDDGTPKMEMTLLADQTINCFFGYLVFKTSNVGLIVGCVVGGAVLLGLIIAGICTGFFKKIFKSRKMRTALKYKSLYLMLIPGLAVLFIFSYAPMFGLLISFQDYDLIGGVTGSEWVGLKHFIHIIFAKDPTIYRIFRNTIYISLIRIGTNFPMILIFTLMLNAIKSARVKSAVQTISYLPYFISWVAVGGMMFSILDNDTGMLNKFLVMFGGKGVNWYAQSDAWWWILALSSLWKSMGWGTIIYISALSCIDGELYDACRIDGGGMFRQAITVTLPGIMNVIMLQLILDSASIVKDNYEQILAMLNGSGAVGDTTTVVGSIGYNAVLTGEGYSVATALGLLQGLIGLGLVLLTNKVAKKSGNEGVL